MRTNCETRFKSIDNASNLAKQATGVKLPEDIHALIRTLPIAERSVWLRKIITEAAQRDLLN